MVEVQCTVDEISLSYTELISPIDTKFSTTEFSTVVEGYGVHNRLYSGYGDGLLLQGNNSSSITKFWYKPKIKIRIPEFVGVSSKLVFSIKLMKSCTPRNSYAILSKEDLPADEVGHLIKRSEGKEDGWNLHLTESHHEVPTETLKKGMISSSLTFLDEGANFQPTRTYVDINTVLYYVFDTSKLTPGVYYIYILHHPDHPRADKGIPPYVEATYNNCQLLYDQYYNLHIQAKLNNGVLVDNFGNYANVTVNGVKCNSYDANHKEGLRYRIIPTSEPHSYMWERYNYKGPTEVSGSLTANTCGILEFTTKSVLNFDSDGVNKLTPIYKNHGYSITLPSCEKFGYNLDGWLKDDKLYIAGQEYNEDPVNIIGSYNLINENTRNQYFKAKWSPKPVTVVFEANGGNVEPTSAQIGYEYKYSGSLPHPYRDGYTFTGWYKDQELTDMISEDTIVEQLTTHSLYAGWLPNGYVIQYLVGSKIVKEEFIPYGQTHDLYSYIVPGYVFNGWYRGTTKFDKPFVVTENLKLVGDYIEVPSIKVYTQKKWKVIVPHVYTNGKWVPINSVTKIHNTLTNFNKYDWLDAKSSDN